MCVSYLTRTMWRGLYGIRSVLTSFLKGRLDSRDIGARYIVGLTRKREVAVSMEVQLI